MRLRFLLIAVSMLLLPVITNAVDASPETIRLQRKIDSLFVIASSGELKYRDKVEPAINEIAKLGAPSVPHLINKFTTRSARERLTVINILKEIGSPAVPDLVAALSRPEWLVVKRVCWALGDIKDSTAVPSLIDVVNHSNWQVREYCVGALGKIGDLRGVNPVKQAFGDSVGQVRKAAAYASGHLQSSEPIGHLIHALGDSFYGARMAAVEALIQLDITEVVYQMRDSLSTVYSFTARMIYHTLGRLGSDDALDVLYSQLQLSDSKRVNYAAVEIVNADPENLCGYQDLIYQKVTDRLTLLQIESAKSAAEVK